MKLIEWMVDNIEQAIVVFLVLGMFVIDAVMLWQIHHDAGRPFL
ncbi:hypothetical protein [Pseudomonas aeruginosa]|nr:hypothetical protein [Pseudomonas aeruginosa]MCS7918663.1 hypothetical protein [Pseudomonas aeruginosa]